MKRVYLLILLLVAAGLIRPIAPLMRFAYPMLVTIAGVYLFRRDRLQYITYVLWVCFLTAFIRRIVEFNAGWLNPSPVLLAQYLAPLVAPVLDLRRLILAPIRTIYPFLLAISALVLSLAVGVVRQPATSVAAAVFTWFTPVLFAMWLTVSGLDLRKLLQQVFEAFYWGVGVMGIYGVIQFFVAPAWDCEWLYSIDAPYTSMGSPEPMGLRVFSTMNSVGVFAPVIACGLVAVNTQKGKLRWLFSAFGMAALVLTFGRSAWLILAVAMTLLSLSRLRHVAGFLATVCGLAFTSTFLVSVSPVHDLVTQRIESMTHLANDESANARLGGLDDALEIVKTNMLGKGLGVPEDLIDDHGGFALHDSGLVETFVTLGWVGGLMYVVGFGMLLWAAVPALHPRTDFLVHTAACLAIAVSLQFPLGSVHLGVIGQMLWMFAAASACSGSDRKLSPLKSNRQRTFDSGKSVVTP
jgi:hypothetical protein